MAPALPFRCTRWLRVRQLGGPVALFICGLTSSFLLCFAECFVHTVSVFCYAFLLVTRTTESGLAVAGGWGIHTPRLSSVAPGFDP